MSLLRTARLRPTGPDLRPVRMSSGSPRTWTEPSNPTDCEQLELHLADCERCIALVGLLSRQRGCGAMEPVPDWTVARARNLVKSGRTLAALTRRSGPPPQWSIVSIAAVTQFAQLPARRRELSMPPDERSTRTVPPTKPTLQVLYPSAGTTA